MKYSSVMVLVVATLITVVNIFLYVTKDYNILTTALDYDKAIELCESNDGVHHIKFNNSNSTQFIKCKDGAEFKVKGK
jgi:hypothetical protein